jgi:hypothetical protein
MVKINLNYFFVGLTLGGIAKMESIIRFYDVNAPASYPRVIFPQLTWDKEFSKKPTGWEIIGQTARHIGYSNRLIPFAVQHPFGNLSASKIHESLQEYLQQEIFTGNPYEITVNANLISNFNGEYFTILQKNGNGQFLAYNIGRRNVAFEKDSEKVVKRVKIEHLFEDNYLVYQNEYRKDQPNQVYSFVHLMNDHSDEVVYLTGSALWCGIIDGVVCTIRTDSTISHNFDLFCDFVPELVAKNNFAFGKK